MPSQTESKHLDNISKVKIQKLRGFHKKLQFSESYLEPSNLQSDSTSPSIIYFHQSAKNITLLIEKCVKYLNINSL